MPETPATSRNFKRYINRRPGLHLGKIQRNLAEGFVVEFDGQVLRMGPEEYLMPELSSAIRLGWLEETDAPPGTPPPAGGPAPAPTQPTPQAVATERVAVQMARAGGGGAAGAAGAAGRVAARGGVISTDQREVSRTFRREEPAAPEAPKKFSAALIRDEGGSGRVVSSYRGAGVEVGSSVDLNDAKVIGGGFSTPTESKVIVGGGTDQTRPLEAVRSSPSNEGVGSGNDNPRVVGSVNGPRAGAPRVAAEDAATRAAARAEERRAVAEAARAKALSEEVPEVDPELAVEAEPTLEEAPSSAEEESVAEPPAPPAAPPLADGEAPLTARVTSDDRNLLSGEAGPIELAPGVYWDKSLHWATRVKKALDYRDRPEILDLILSVEAPAVVAGINRAIRPAP